MDEAHLVESTSEEAHAEVEDDDTSQGDTPRGFDPNKIRVKKIDLVVSNVMEKLKAGEIDLAPEFQRNRVWDLARESRLVESLLMRIPLPVFYFDELPPEPGYEERYAVIDGVQRLTALNHFINDKSDDRLRLQGLEALTQLKDKSFDDLDPSLKRRLLSAQLVAYAIEPGTPPEAKLNIFKRINTGGLTLTPQEIRHAMNPGVVREFLKELVEIPEFKAAVGSKAAKQLSLRMGDRECAIRFIAFIDGGVARYRKSTLDLDGFLHAAMARVNGMAEPARGALAARFRRAMGYAHRCFGRLAFRKPAAGGPLNKSLFEATAVALDARSDAELETLARRQEQLITVYKAALLDQEVFQSISASTGDANRVDTRFNALRSVLDRVLAEGIE